MPVQERHHLPTHLQVRHIAVQVDPIQALDVQGHLPIKHTVHRQRAGHRHRLPALQGPDQPEARRSEAKPR
jgi:hypothetical protein